MDERMTKVNQLAYDSGTHLGDYIQDNPPRAFSGGKVKNKEIEQTIQRMTANIDQAEKAVGIESTCRKGCAACCTHSIVSDGFDVDMIWNYLQRNYDQETVRRTKERIFEVASVLDENFGPAPKSPFQVTEMIKNQDIHKWRYFDLKLPCPLLSEDNSCMVYPVRPTPCWSYRAYGDPQHCETTHDIPDTLIYKGHEGYFLERKKMSVKSGTVPKSISYHLVGFLPQKLRDAMNNR
jgi:Fe-S-cluster containining protein